MKRILSLSKRKVAMLAMVIAIITATVAAAPVLAQAQTDAAVQKIVKLAKVALFAKNADKLDGKDSTFFAPVGLFNATEVYNNNPGALPLTTGTFTSKGGTLVIAADGSGFRTAAAGAGVVGMTVLVDGTARGDVKVFTNETLSHKAFVAHSIVVKGLAAGSHTIALQPLTGTTTDANDFFNVEVTEIAQSP
jgi:hypothetical protein